MRGLRQVLQRLVRGRGRVTLVTRPRMKALESQLAVNPVRQLHQEAVVGRKIEQIVQVAAEGARALETGGPLPALTPHHKQRRSRPVLPAEHHVRAELLEVESTD